MNEVTIYNKEDNTLIAKVFIDKTDGTIKAITKDGVCVNVDGKKLERQSDLTSSSAIDLVKSLKSTN